MKKSQALKSVRKEFPILKTKTNGKPLVYLDSAATSQKPKAVLDTMQEFYENYNANIHRGVYAISEKATEQYENARGRVAEFIGAKDSSEIVFTSGTTQSVNLVAYTWGFANVKRGDNVVTTIMEHHSNFVPWLELCKKKGVQLRIALITKDGKIDLKEFYQLINRKTKLVVLTHVSNVLGTINPIERITKTLNAKPHTPARSPFRPSSSEARQGRLYPKIFIDGAQAVPHMLVNVQKLGCDFYVFSGHKMLAPTGVGVLWAKRELLEETPPFLTGGHMIREVTTRGAGWNDVPWKFEAGTAPIAEVIGLGAAIDYLTKIGMNTIRAYEECLTRYAMDKMKRIPGLVIYGPQNPRDRVGVISFTVEGAHPHDLATLLDEEGIAIRAGHHCAMPLHREALKIEASVRASFYIYNTKQEVDKLVRALAKVRRILGI